MTYTQLLQILDSRQVTLKKTCRLYAYALLGGQFNSHLEELERKMMIQCGNSRETLDCLMEEQWQSWSFKIARLELLLSRSFWMKNFIASHKREFSLSALPRNSSEYLLLHTLSLILQKASLQSFSNHMKPRDVQILLELLKDPRHLGSCSKELFYPLMQVLKGNWGVISDIYLISALARIQCAADAYLAYIQDQPAKEQAALDALRSFKYRSLEELEQFLG